MTLTHRPVSEDDICIFCGFLQNEDELFFLYIKATFSLLSAQLRNAIGKRKDPTVVELDGNVIVSPDARGRGVGRYLIEQMIDIAFSRHQVSEIEVSCFNDNVAGLLFYSKLGFRPYDVEKRKNRRGKRVALMHIELQRNEI